MILLVYSVIGGGNMAASAQLELFWYYSVIGGGNIVSPAHL